MKNKNGNGKATKREQDPGSVGKSKFSDVVLPESFQRFDSDTKREALRRATILVEQGYRKPLALRMAAVLAQEWVDNGKLEKHEVTGASLHVMYDVESWLICAENAGEPIATFNNFEHAVQRAHELATRNHSAVYVHDPDGALIDKYERYGGGEDGIYHVIPHDDGGWAVTLNGQDGVCKHFGTKREAIAMARPRAIADHTTLVIHYQDGKVQRAVDYHR